MANCKHGVSTFNGKCNLCLKEDDLCEHDNKLYTKPCIICLDSYVDTLKDSMSLNWRMLQEGHDNLSKRIGKLEFRVEQNSNSIGCVDSAYNEIVDKHEL